MSNSDTTKVAGVPSQPVIMPCLTHTSRYTSPSLYKTHFAAARCLSDLNITMTDFLEMGIAQYRLVQIFLTGIIVPGPGARSSVSRVYGDRPKVIKFLFVFYILRAKT